MICITDCSECKNKLPLKDGWLACCTAFPNGHPKGFDYSDLKKRKVCNPDNGIGFEPIEQKDDKTA